MARRPALAALAGVLALAAAGCGGGSGGGGGGAATASSAASIVPASAPGFATLNTDLDSSEWSQVDALLRRFPGRAKLIAALRRSARKELGVEFERDVRPALGPELDVVWLDFANGGANAVALLQPGDESAFQALLRKGNAKDPADRLFSQRIGDWTAVSDTRAKLARLARLYDQKGPTLDDLNRFREAQDAQPDEAVATVYVDGRSLTRLAGSASTPVAGVDLGCLPTGAAGGEVAWIAGALRAEDGGAGLELHVQTTPPAADAAASAELQPYAPKLVDEIPGGVLAYASFSGLERTFQAIRRACPALDKQLAPAERVLGVSVDELAALFGGEGALYVRQGAPLPEVTLVLSVDDEQAALATADRLAASAARQLGSGRPESSPISGIAAKRVDLGGFALYYAVFDGKLVLTDLTTGISALADTSTPRLADDDLFKTARSAAGVPDETTGFLYVDLKNAVPYLSNFAAIAGQDIPPDVRANLEPLRSAFLYGEQDGDLTTLEAFVEIK